MQYNQFVAIIMMEQQTTIPALLTDFRLYIDVRMTATTEDELPNIILISRDLELFAMQSLPLK